MNILVTGAAGFIGSSVVLGLLEKENYNVVGVDSITTYYDVNLKLARLNKQGVNLNSSEASSNLFKNYSFLKLDLSKKSSFDKLEKYNFDLVIHLAAQAGVRYSITHPEQYIDSNILAFFNILEFSRKNNISKVIYASSSSVYGNLDITPFTEDVNVDRPVSLYAATKKSNELMAHTYTHLFGIKTIGLRFFTVYGPWGRPDMAPFIFTKAILNNEQIKLFNYGNNKRDFTYISDIVEAIQLLIENIDNLPAYEIYNIGFGDPYSTIEFVQILESYIGKKANLVLTPPVAGDVNTTFADISKLKQAIGFEPKIGLKEGLKLFLDWYLSYFESNH
jgi:UDP-glucuronate 4-epimerase